MFQDNFSLDQKRAIITLLIQLAEEEGDLSHPEAGYIKGAAEFLGLDQRELEGLTIQKGDLKLDIPKSEKDRMSMLYFFLFLSSADGVVGPEERQFCERLGIRLGFNPQMTSKLLNVISDNLHHKLDPEKMITIIRSFLN